MGTTVNLWRDAVEAHGRNLFSCSAHEWRFLLEVAQTFGWVRAGTTYDMQRASKLDVAALRDYQPGEPSDPKLVSAADANEWARALEAAGGSPRLDAIVESHSTAAEEAPEVRSKRLHVLLREFVDYAYGGSFSFAQTTAEAEDRAS